MKYAQSCQARDPFLSKNRRQARFVARCSSSHMSQAQVIEAARFIPKHMIQQFEVVHWVR